jgi:membrane-anchored glycerophosphoryl diester phosphodiesterase (GDPDase)
VFISELETGRSDRDAASAPVVASKRAMLKKDFFIHFSVMARLFFIQALWRKIEACQNYTVPQSSSFLS